MSITTHIPEKRLLDAPSEFASTFTTMTTAERILRKMASFQSSRGSHGRRSQKITLRRLSLTKFPLYLCKSYIWPLMDQGRPSRTLVIIALVNLINLLN